VPRDEIVGQRHRNAEFDGANVIDDRLGPAADVRPLTVADTVLIRRELPMAARSVCRPDPGDNTVPDLWPGTQIRLIWRAYFVCSRRVARVAAMLTVTRKPEQAVRLLDPQQRLLARILVAQVRGNQVSLAIQADRAITILREEIVPLEPDQRPVPSNDELLLQAAAALEGSGGRNLLNRSPVEAQALNLAIAAVRSALGRI